MAILSVDVFERSQCNYKHIVSVLPPHGNVIATNPRGPGLHLISMTTNPPEADGAIHATTNYS